jgi:hypothetical protein
MRDFAIWTNVGKGRWAVSIWNWILTSILALLLASCASGGTQNGLRLTKNEFEALRRQLVRCWNFPAGAKDAGPLIVEIKVVVNRDRTIRSAHIVDVARMRRDPYYRSAAESALRVFANPRCSPLKLPPHKYQIWRTMTVTFDPREFQSR